MSPPARHKLSLVAAALLGLPLFACSTALPKITLAPGAAVTHAAPIATAPTKDANGIMSPGRSAAVLQAVRAEGRSRQFDRHLSILEREQEILSRGNTVQLLVDGPATFESMFAALEGAQHSILLESYIVEADEIGQRIATILKRKRAEGVDVRLIYDGVGSFSTPPDFFAELREAGIDVCEFNPLGIVRRTFGLLEANHRDHRKVLVVDGRIAFTGGINLSNVYLSASLGSTRRKRFTTEDGWRDTHVRIEGPAAADFTNLFRDTWQRQNCGGSPIASHLPETASAAPPAGKRLVAVIGSVAGENSDRLYRTLLSAIVGATDSIHITMAYFVPDPQTLKALADAARRGVDVVLVLPGQGDSLITLRAGQSHYGQLLEAGVRIFEMQGSFLHAKTAVIDGVWATVGSANLDWRSFLHNDELNVIVLGEDFGSRMEALFATDLAHSEPVSQEEWAARCAPRRMMEQLGRLLEYWL